MALPRISSGASSGAKPQARPPKSAEGAGDGAALDNEPDARTPLLAVRTPGILSCPALGGGSRGLRPHLQSSHASRDSSLRAAYQEVRSSSLAKVRTPSTGWGRAAAYRGRLSATASALGRSGRPCSRRFDCAGWVFSLAVLHPRALPNLLAGSRGPASSGRILGRGSAGAPPRAGPEGSGRG